MDHFDTEAAAKLHDILVLSHGFDLQEAFELIRAVEKEARSRANSEWQDSNKYDTHRW